MRCVRYVHFSITPLQSKTSGCASIYAACSNPDKQKIKSPSMDCSVITSSDAAIINLSLTFGAVNHRVNPDTRFRTALFALLAQNRLKLRDCSKSYPCNSVDSVHLAAAQTCSPTAGTTHFPIDRRRRGALRPTQLFKSTVIPQLVIFRYNVEIRRGCARHTSVYHYSLCCCHIRVDCSKS